jgi:predicted enzyme related to lactoylglutathione lyase
MNGRISQVALVVSDQSAALEFYTTKVGFEKKADMTPPGVPRWVTVGLPGQDLELVLYQVGDKPNPQDPDRRWRPASTPPIQIRVEDCRATFREMKERGVKFHQSEPGSYPWGIVATFQDPDGNLFSLLEPPKSWPGGGR